MQCTGCPERPILLKNPNDAANFLYIRSVFPKSRFVFIDRHPIDWVNSVLRLLQDSVEKKNPYMDLIFPPPWFWKIWGVRHVVRWAFSPPKPFLLRLVARIGRKERRKICDRMPKLSADCYTRLRYEDLTRDPQKTLQNVFDFLGLSPKVAVDYRQEIAPRPRRWIPEVERAKEWLCKLFGCGVEEGDYPT